MMISYGKIWRIVGATSWVMYVFLERISCPEMNLNLDWNGLFGGGYLMVTICPKGNSVVFWLGVSAILDSRIPSIHV